MKYTNKKVIDLKDWDELVQNTYGKPYSFQQQDGCQGRGMVGLSVPCENDDEEMNDSIREEINGGEMGVKFKVWLETDPATHTKRNSWEPWYTELFWERNFYPSIQAIANDLHEKGLIEAGEYFINIDW